jgi:hypothetical protein
MDEVGEETMEQEEEKNGGKNPTVRSKNDVQDQECSHHKQKMTCKIKNAVTTNKNPFLNLKCR